MILVVKDKISWLWKIMEKIIEFYCPIYNSRIRRGETCVLRMVKRARLRVLSRAFEGGETSAF